MISNGIEPAQNRQRLHLTGWFIVWILHEGSALFGAPSQLLWSARRENISHTHLHLIDDLPTITGDFTSDDTVVPIYFLRDGSCRITDTTSRFNSNTVFNSKPATTPY